MERTVFCFILALSQISAEPCATPDSKEGSCIPIDDCPLIKLKLDSLEDLSTDDITFIRRSGCPGDVAKVCCQISNKTLQYKFPPKPEKGVPLDFRGDEDDDESLLPSFCGEQDNEDRIIGPICNIDEFPWMALLKYQTDDGKGYACGGVLISKRYVLTAAHCMGNRNLGEPIEVTLGEYDIRTTRDCIIDYGEAEDCSEPQYIPVESILVHPLYKSDNPAKKHDIALIRLTKNIQETAFVHPICLPNEKIIKKQVVPKKVMQVAGWGKTKNHLPSSIKRKARVPVVDRQQCSKNRSFQIDDTQLCAGGGAEDSCAGDSGGPLMFRNIEDVNDLKWYVIGIVSFGPKRCASKDIPSVYTNVVPYVQWIKDSIMP